MRKNDTKAGDLPFGTGFFVLFAIFPFRPFVCEWKTLVEKAKKVE